MVAKPTPFSLRIGDDIIADLKTRLTRVPDGARIGVPMGYAEFPKEILRPPRSLAEKMYNDIRRWS